MSKVTAYTPAKITKNVLSVAHLLSIKKKKILNIDECKELFVNKILIIDLAAACGKRVRSGDDTSDKNSALFDVRIWTQAIKEYYCILANSSNIDRDISEILAVSKGNHVLCDIDFFYNNFDEIRKIVGEKYKKALNQTDLY